MVHHYAGDRHRTGWFSILPSLRRAGPLLLLFGLLWQTATAQYRPPGDLTAATQWVTPSAYAVEDDSTARLNMLIPQMGDQQLKKRPQKLTVFGYYRLFLYGRDMTDPYPNLAPFERTYGVGDGYREPMLSMNVLARPNGRSSFGTELFFFTPYLGTGAVDNVFSVNLGLNFYGNFRTEYGSFGVRAGGIHWYNLSPFTVGVYQVLDRFSIFDRTPWEGVTHTDKYDAYYNTGSVNVGDLRWNFQAFQGLALNGGKLPGDFAFDLFWGKMQPNGGLPGALADPTLTIQNPGQAGNIPTYQGFTGDRRVLPSYVTGGKIAKTFGAKRQTVALNTIYSHTVLDSISGENWNNQVTTISYDLKVGDGISIAGEIGASSFQSPITEQLWGEALMVRVKVPKKYTVLPIDFQVYQIGADFFSQSGEINTASNPEIQQNFVVNVPAGQVGAGGLLTQTNQLAHNRRGFNLNTGWEYKDLKLNFGYGLAAELEVQNSELSFVHRVNGLALSRIYNPFPANAVGATTFGPYGRKVSFFRGASEVVQTTDLDPVTAAPLTRKYYHSVDLQAKYKTELADRVLYLFYIGNLQSAKSEATVLPGLDESSYLYVQYHEIDLYYELFDGFLLAGYLGLERAQGGRFTRWGETNLPLNQTGRGYGLGFDWTVNDATGIYFRYRHMEFEDESFELDRLRGNEFTLELKNYF
ncbi:MAG: hypothetical protein AAFN81_04275 [Bacteroidota bacterium]